MDAESSGREDPDQETRRRLLLQYVQNVDPTIMDQFVQRAPSQVVEAMRQTVSNMLGTLPPQFFEVTVTSLGENLAQLMYSVMMTGYMFRNAQYRIELRTSLLSLPSNVPSNGLLESETLTSYAPGTQKNQVQGKVLRWNEHEGVEAIPAVEYIEALEIEVAALKERVAGLQKSRDGQNEMLEYIKTLEPHNLQDLTATAGPEVLEAMNAFVHRLIGTSDGEELRNADTTSTTVELARMLYWLMVVGYSLRTMEVKLEMERSLDIPPTGQSPELPPA
eukprot:CAMPEP_0114236192 /NCGR_PEP_ID=MMETSP0058-20121206/6701_1 /TAXON_ID=36894 /ORGANISM="Pyramimonas parkeae, CCMP726" /LENGTH=276 /DNA_ID=CAMNT_0001348101 /DNA_START=302 /DNA_END=1132 /DNA_ORIENTATION=-